MMLIVTAMEAEERALLAGRRAKTSIVGKPAGLAVRLHELKLPGRRVLIARAGVGPVNAGILLAQVLAHRKVDAVVLLGVAGALDEKLRPGDVVVADRVLQHDSVLSARRGTFLIAPGELYLSRGKNERVDPVMPCDPFLTQWALTSLQTRWTRGVYRGTMLSGGEFVGNAARKRALRALAPDALAVDMEAAALAQVCRRLKLPFAAIKTVADRARPGGSVSKDYARFLETAARSAALVLEGLLERST